VLTFQRDRLIVESVIPPVFATRLLGVGELHPRRRR